MLHFNLDTFLIILSVKQEGIKYHFKSLWYDVTWDCTQVSRTIGELVKYLILIILIYPSDCKILLSLSFLSLNSILLSNFHVSNTATQAWLQFYLWCLIRVSNILKTKCYSLEIKFLIVQPIIPFVLLSVKRFSWSPLDGYDWPGRIGLMLLSIKKKNQLYKRNVYVSWSSSVRSQDGELVTDWNVDLSGRQLVSGPSKTEWNEK